MDSPCVPVYSTGGCVVAEPPQASWDDVILDAKFKGKVQHDYRSFFKSEDVYKNLGVPWKRGLIFLGVSDSTVAQF